MPTGKIASKSFMSMIDGPPGGIFGMRIATEFRTSHKPYSKDTYENPIKACQINKQLYLNIHTIYLCSLQFLELAMSAIATFSLSPLVFSLVFT